MDKQKQGLKAYKEGHGAEKIALLYLLLKGYLPVRMNWKAGVCLGASEIDLIVKKGKNLVFVEVKKRPTFDACAESLTPRVQQRILRAAELFLSDNPSFETSTLRFDSVWIAGGKIKHIQDVFEGE